MDKSGVQAYLVWRTWSPRPRLGYHDNCCARRLYSVRSGPSCDLLGDEMYKGELAGTRTQTGTFVSTDAIR
jgi:hypothetical protein